MLHCHLIILINRSAPEKQNFYVFLWCFSLAIFLTNMQFLVYIRAQIWPFCTRHAINYNISFMSFVPYIFLKIIMVCV